MKKSEFVAECAKRLIDPGLALENAAIVEALRARDDKKVIEILEAEF